ncbi:MAG TPA: uracil-DNA glycosylase [Candidatus Bathyarchaeia archaeon]|nr:uracil-DNA glycosylase [Candidatus Bathyarchaeia archaeon]
MISQVDSVSMQTSGPGRATLVNLNSEIVGCRLCSRLVRYRERIARDKRTTFLDWNYWGRPVPGFGDPRAWLLIVGLAPAAHGGNRTGRVFTGDRSGDFLFQCLYNAGFSNQPLSINRGDGLRLSGAYITAAVKCAPPENRPLPEEMMQCSRHLTKEIRALSGVRAILCLGQFALRAVTKLIVPVNLADLRSIKFAHGAEVNLGGPNPRIFCSYHPSPRNTQTGRLTEGMMVSLLRKIRRAIEA